MAAQVQPSRQRYFLGAAVLIGCLFIYLLFTLISKKADRPQSRRGTSIGSVTAVIGHADFRASGGLTFAQLKRGDTISAGELVTVRETSQVTLRFVSGTVLRLQPGARVVTERDSTRGTDAILVTVLDGNVDLIDAGRDFRLLKGGRDITTAGAQAAPPEALIVSGGGRLFPSGPRTGPSGDVVVAATTPVETPVPTSSPSSRVGDETGGTVSADSLSNDEIRKSMANESGFYRRCYLTFLNRESKPAEATGSGSGTGSAVTVGFVISNNGKVRDAKIVRSDFQDATLNNCVLETVERTSFRAFKANDIPVLEFPIELK